MVTVNEALARAGLQMCLRLWVGLFPYIYSFSIKISNITFKSIFY
jgi:hypothetical protein